MASGSSDGGRVGVNSESSYQQLITIPREVTSVLEEEAGSDKTARPTDISMLHDYAMDHVFSFLPMADLKNCRLVNRYWNRVSNRAIQKRDYVFMFPKDRYNHNPHQEVYGIADIPKLCQLISTSFQFPWTKFKVNAWCSMNSDRYNAEKRLQLANLFRTISPFATELEVSGLEHLDIPEFPNLRKLVLDAIQDTALTTETRNSLLQLVERAAKLNDIVLLGDLDDNTPLYMDILESSTCRKITRLSLDGWMDAEHLIRLSELGLQLKFLSLSFKLPGVTAVSLRAILQSQSSFLEHLELSCDDLDFYDEDDEAISQRLLGMEFPQMEKLKELMVYSINLNSPISYKDMFPALRKLSFYAYERYPVDSFLNDDVDPVETVEYLRFGNWSRNPERILQAARQFPKVSRISLEVSGTVLNVLGHAMPQLEEMELQLGSDVDLDVILTGFSSEEVETLKGLPSNQLDVLERSKQPVHFLKNLKRLRLTNRVYSSVVQRSLSDFGCRFALLKMEHLLVLELKWLSNCFQITKHVLERMRKKFAVRRVRTEN